MLEVLLSAAIGWLFTGRREDDVILFVHVQCSECPSFSFLSHYLLSCLFSSYLLPSLANNLFLFPILSLAPALSLSLFPSFPYFSLPHTLSITSFPLSILLFLHPPSLPVFLPYFACFKKT